jgi:hypothetical protein
MSRARRHVAEETAPTDLGESADEVSQSLSIEGKTKKRRASARPKGDKALIVRASYESTKELEFRLSHLAKKEGMRKYDFVFKLLDQGCAPYTLDPFLKEVFAKIQGEAVKVA